MENVEEKVKYFIDLVYKNIQMLVEDKPKYMSKEEMVFFNYSIYKQKISVYNQEKDLMYDISIKEIQDAELKNIDKNYVLNIIELLTKYMNNEISYKKFLHLFCN